MRRLEQIGCAVTDHGNGTLSVVPPSWRPDLTMDADLVEEVLRLEGLEQIPSVVPAAPAGRGLTPTQRAKRGVGHALALSGHVEVLAFPFVNPQVFDDFGLDAEDPRRTVMTLLNPLEADFNALATTLLPAMIDVARRNLARGQKSLSLFAIEQVFLPTETTGPMPPLDVKKRPTPAELEALNASLPQQPVHVASLYTGEREPSGHWGTGRAADALDAVAAARTVAAAAGADITVRAAQYAPWHPGRCVEIMVDTPSGETVVGHAGELHPAVLERLELPKRTCAMEIDLSALGVGEILPAPQISPFPAVLQDVALVVDDDVPAETVRQAVLAGAGELCESVRLFDIYTGSQLGDGKKSLAFALSFRAADRTLTEDEASAARGAAIERAAADVGAVLRGE